MPTETVRFRGTSAEARAMLRELPAVLSGRAPDRYGVADGILLRGAVALLSQIKQAFLVKTRGGTDAAGITWPPLSPATIAARRTTAAERKRLGIRQGRTRPTLTDAQDKRWRGIYASRLAQLRARGMSEGEAAGRAAAAAWSILKQAGAKTKLELLGSRDVDILRDTSRLFRSLSPGIEDAPAAQPDQILAAGPGRLTVGTKTPYAAAHHRGIPGRLPRRALWPADGKMPPAWNAAVAGALARGMLRAVVLLLTRGR